MNKDYQVIAKKSAKVAGAFAMATGIVALSAVVASGAAVGAMVEGFKSAKDAVKKSLAKSENEKPEAERVEATNAEAATEEVANAETANAEAADREQTSAVQVAEVVTEIEA